MKKLLPKFLKRWYHLAWAILSIVVYGRPSKKMVVIGVTGTDGKTTTTTMLHEILKASGKKVAMINGLQFSLPSREWKNHSDNSTPGKLIIRKFLKQAVDEECEVVILEATSWGIEQYRLLGICFDVSVITNFTYEHLDLHGTMERYREMKGKLFRYLGSHKKPGQKKVAILNIDDEHHDFFQAISPSEKVNYSRLVESDIYATDITIKGTSTAFMIHQSGQTAQIQMGITGMFNVSNALAAAGAALAVGVSLDDIAKGLNNVHSVPGRMEFIDEGQDYYVIVDFAHTPNGFESLFESARELVGKDHAIIAVYGATGGRDTGRRPMVGEIAAKYVDFSVLTSEDPRTEDPRQIARDIEKGLNKHGKKEERDYLFIKDRSDAIQEACKRAKPGDAVLLCSMGDYDVMYVGTGKVKWSDREAAKKAIKQT